MKIALVFTPLRLRRNWSTLVAQDERVGIMPPLSLAYVAAVAKKSGQVVIVNVISPESFFIDLSVGRLQVAG